TRIAVAMPTPMSFRNDSGLKAKARKTATMIAADAVITRAVRASPSVTARPVWPWRRNSSRTRDKRGRMSPPRVRVLVVDDADLMRAGLRAVLSSDESLIVVGEARRWPRGGRAGASAAAGRRADGRPHAGGRRD